MRKYIAEVHMKSGAVLKFKGSDVETKWSTEGDLTHIKIDKCSPPFIYMRLNDISCVTYRKHWWARW